MADVQDYSPLDDDTVIVYQYRGQAERGTATEKRPRPGYRWVDSYSETVNGRVSYPWMTRAECRADAKSRGKRAVFVEGAAVTVPERASTAP